MKRVLFALLIVTAGVACQRGQHNASRTRNDVATADRITQPGTKVDVGVVHSADREVVSIDRSGGANLLVRVTPQTVVMRNGLPTRNDVLQEGAEVRATYAAEGDENVASRIDVIRLSPNYEMPSGGEVLPPPVR